MILSNSNIIQLLKNKDQQAITVIIEQYGDILYGIIYRKVQSEVLARIVMKRTFVMIWQQAATYEETNERLFNWLVRIAHQAMSGHLQKAA